MELLALSFLRGIVEYYVYFHMRDFFFYLKGCHH